jgi:hypothetical protein
MQGPLHQPIWRSPRLKTHFLCALAGYLGEEGEDGEEVEEGEEGEEGKGSEGRAEGGAQARRHLSEDLAHLGGYHLEEG